MKNVFFAISASFALTACEPNKGDLDGIVNQPSSSSSASVAYRDGQSANAAGTSNASSQNSGAGSSATTTTTTTPTTSTTTTPGTSTDSNDSTDPGSTVTGDASNTPLTTTLPAGAVRPSEYQVVGVSCAPIALGNSHFKATFNLHYFKTGDGTAKLAATDKYRVDLGDVATSNNIAGYSSASIRLVYCETTNNCSPVEGTLASFVDSNYAFTTLLAAGQKSLTSNPYIPASKPDVVEFDSVPANSVRPYSIFPSGIVDPRAVVVDSGLYKNKSRVNLLLKMNTATLNSTTTYDSVLTVYAPNTGSNATTVPYLLYVFNSRCTATSLSSNIK